MGKFKYNVPFKCKGLKSGVVRETLQTKLVKARSKKLILRREEKIIIINEIKSNPTAKLADIVKNPFWKRYSSRTVPKTLVEERKKERKKEREKERNRIY